MVYAIHYSNKFKKQYKKLVRSGDKKMLAELKSVITFISEGKKLSPNYDDHKLTGKLKDFRECHIFPDLLLIYKIHEDFLVLELVATGTHSDLFR